MKKKSLLLSLIPLLSFSFSSCGAPQATFNKINIDFGHVRKQAQVLIGDSYINYDDLKYKLTFKESFIVCVYPHYTCGCWDTFQKILVSYQNAHNMDVFVMEDTEFEAKSTFGLDFSKVFPAIAIARRGTFEVTAYYGDNSSRPIFAEYQKFEAWISNYINEPKSIFKIDEALLDQYIEEGKSFNLYVGRNKCGDCAELEDKLLHTYVDNQVEFSETLYFFDMEKYRGTADYQAKKDKYGLSEEGNATYGYNYTLEYQGADQSIVSDVTKGAFPTLHRYKDGQIYDGMVLLNDFPNLVGGEPYKINTTYFTSERINNIKCIPADKKENYILKDKSITKEEFTNWFDSTTNVKFSYHKPMAELFFETYLLKK